MTQKQETFAQLMSSFAYHFDLRTVFDDLLTMSICAVGQDPAAGKSYDENLYLETIGKYTKSKQRFVFRKLFARLVAEMDERVSAPNGNDVLGEYYEQQFCSERSGQFFTPPHVCDFMATSICGDMADSPERKRVLDPACGSGRMLLSAAKTGGKHHEFYGIDIDHTCVKMAALNLFLNGMFHSEVMWADALRPDDFRISYKISLLPFGIFRIRDNERSRLWHLYRHSFGRPQQRVSDGLSLPSDENGLTGSENNSQLKLF